MMTGILITLALVIALMLLYRHHFGFAAQKPADYSAGPAFDLRRHLNGPILCEGVIYGPTGRVTSRFIGDMQADWQGSTGVMTEKFRYDSGMQQDRVWTLNLGKDGQISAEAPDVLGQGTGQVTGSAAVLHYSIRLADSAGGHVLDVTDWMYLMENGTIMNRSQFSKFGIRLGELVATMRPKVAL